jgi:hypothetical protein
LEVNRPLNRAPLRQTVAKDKERYKRDDEWKNKQELKKQEPKKQIAQMTHPHPYADFEPILYRVTGSSGRRSMMPLFVSDMFGKGTEQPIATVEHRVFQTNPYRSFKTIVPGHTFSSAYQPLRSQVWQAT